MLKKIIKLLLVFCLFLFSARPALAAEVVLDFFYGQGCPHCAKEKVFLEKLSQKYPSLTVNKYEIYSHPENSSRLKAIGQELQADTSGVPFTVIGKKYFSGYTDADTTGKAIETEILRQLGENPTEIKPESISLPLFGKIAVKNLSLPLLTFLVALLDGFNPCAMWTLLFLISLLLGMKDRTRMWALGIAFIITSSFVYFLFLSAWLNLFLFLGLVVWIRLLIGLVALGSGGYYLKDYFTNTRGGCNVMGDEKRQKMFEKIKNITQKKQFIFALGGIILLAFAVNLVELICSAGLPAIYTKILSLANLPSWQYYLYLIFYIFIFMLDDLFIFFTAMITLQAVGIQSKYSRLSHLIGGLLMLLIGGLLIFKPEWLMFG